MQNIIGCAFRPKIPSEVTGKRINTNFKQVNFLYFLAYKQRRTVFNFIY